MRALIFLCFVILSLSGNVYADGIPLTEMQGKIYEHEDAIYEKERNVEEKKKDYREALRELDRKKARQCFESRSDYQACLGDRGADIQKAQWGVDEALQSLDSAEGSSESAKLDLAKILESFIDFKEKYYRENRSQIPQFEWNKKLSNVFIERQEIKVFQEKFSVSKMKRSLRSLESEFQKEQNNLNSKKSRPCIESRSDYQACLADRGADIQRAQWGVDKAHKRLEEKKNELAAAEDELKYSQTNLAQERERAISR